LLCSHKLTHTFDMGRLGWMLAGLVVLFFLTCVKFHNTSGRFVEGWSVEIRAPWR
jgi:hypothetical protein